MKEITLKVKDIKEYILIHFGKLMTDNGFLYKKTDNEFFCSKGDYTYIFNMPLTSWSRSYELSVRLFIKQKRIENVYESILGKSHGLTLNQEMIERIYYSPDGRKIVKGDGMGIWLVKDNDIINAVDILNIYYNKIAKPYFERFSTLGAFDDFMNNPPFDHSPAYIGSTTNERCMKGLIVAKLVNNPNYEKLVAIYDELIKRTLSDVQPDSITNYNKVKEYLEHNKLPLKG
ncbi:hypothetical protein [Mucilaginibacter sp.]|uniref:hypothetical protein n=1 Tax=Mucilaginibacter sp. TaxID=1882438 RepID=UPI00260D496C|nr:hypothetical protein [Mucilaginibacter sp.]MDB4921873.1 hypothetical protein [Mucilaginibacter sp.]